MGFKHTSHRVSVLQRKDCFPYGTGTDHRMSGSGFIEGLYDFNTGGPPGCKVVKQGCDVGFFY